MVAFLPTTFLPVDEPTPPPPAFTAFFLFGDATAGDAIPPPLAAAPTDLLPPCFLLTLLALPPALLLPLPLGEGEETTTSTLPPKPLPTPPTKDPLLPPPLLPLPPAAAAGEDNEPGVPGEADGEPFFPLLFPLPFRFSAFSRTFTQSEHTNLNFFRASGQEGGGMAGAGEGSSDNNLIYGYLVKNDDVSNEMYVGWLESSLR